MSGIVNKVKDALHGDSHHKHTEGSHGPHNSRAANAADPRVDSDLDGSHRTAVGTGRVAGHGEVGSGTTHHATTGTGTAPGSGVSGMGMGQGGATGLSAREGMHSGTAGYGTGTHNTVPQAAGTGLTGTTGTHGAPTGTHGPHNSRIANAADPRVDSDRDGRAAIGTGPGPAANTAGPHKNDMLNKVDPRVDSDLDGSRTVGGNKTYNQ